jgi:oxygen-dependent protoporphyrinogen oxidase
MSAVSRHVVIIGGGITGLSSAYALGEQGRSPESRTAATSTLLEAMPRLGGKILTEQADGFVIEAGPDSFLAQKPWGVELCRRLGISDRLMGTNPEHRRTLVLRDGRLHELPEGMMMGLPTKFGAFLKSSLLSWKGKLRLAGELFIPPRRDDEDESLAAFFRRRLGPEALDRMIEPLLTGIYTGDAERLSLLATFPRFRELERQHGSLIRAVLAAKFQERKAGRAVESGTPFVTLRGGLGELVEALAAKLPATEVVTSARVQAVRRRSERGGYEILLEARPPLVADAIIFTTPAYVTAHLLEPLAQGLSEQLYKIPYASSATVSLGYKKSDLRHDLDGYGFVVPRIENRKMMASTWTSSKWPNRAASETALIRCYLGGIGREAILEQPDMGLIQTALGELRAILGIDQLPLLARVHRWPQAMPQYQVGHLQRLESIRKVLRDLPGVFLAGAAYRGVGIPDCIRDGGEAAANALRYFDKEM